MSHDSLQIRLAIFCPRGAKGVNARQPIYSAKVLALLQERLAQGRLDGELILCDAEGRPL